MRIKKSINRHRLRNNTDGIISKDIKSYYKSIPYLEKREKHEHVQET